MLNIKLPFVGEEWRLRHKLWTERNYRTIDLAIAGSHNLALQCSYTLWNVVQSIRLRFLI